MAVSIFMETAIFYVPTAIGVVCLMAHLRHHLDRQRLLLSVRFFRFLDAKLLAPRIQTIPDFVFSARHNGRCAGVPLQFLSPSRTPDGDRHSWFCGRRARARSGQSISFSFCAHGLSNFKSLRSIAATDEQKVPAASLVPAGFSRQKRIDR